MVSWAAIVGDKIVGPFRIPEGVKLNVAKYCKFLEDNFLPWLNNQPENLKKDLMFQQDNAPSHAAKKTMCWLEANGFPEAKRMTWPALSPDLSPIENICFILNIFYTFIEFYI